MRVLIVGLGSIASKHINALKKLRAEVNIFALRSSLNSAHHEGVTNIYDWSEVPRDLDFIMICNPTSEHHVAMKRALEFDVPIFLEKPPFMDLEYAWDLSVAARSKQIIVYSAFNMRFHPLIEWLKEYINGSRILEVQAYCGSYLPDWRPGRDYRKVYSAIDALGGGVHLDLIHELDYLIWLFGFPNSHYSFASRISDLEIDSNDIAHYWLAYDKMVISIILNYYRRDPVRRLTIVTSDDTLSVDLLSGVIVNSKGEVLLRALVDMEEIYVKQMSYFLNVIHLTQPLMNGLEESLRVLELCLNRNGK
jgi:predicted dehydrogenase